MLKNSKQSNQLVLKQVSLNGLIQATSAKVVHRAKILEHVDSISTDSRQFYHDTIFIALNGDYFNGHDFILDVIQQGVSVLILQHNLFDKEVAAICQKYCPGKVWVLLVDSTVKACQDIARCILSKWNGLRIAVTGSNGKTSTKEIIKSIFSQSLSVLASRDNWNNQLGVPKTIFDLSFYHDCLLVELASGKKGDIHCISLLVGPDFGLITSIGNAHVQYLQNLDGIIKEKSDIYDGFHTQSKAILNADSLFYHRLKEKLNFSQLICIYPKTDPLFSIEKQLGFHGYLLNIYSEVVRFPLIGEWNLVNLHFALKLAQQINLPINNIINGVKKIVPVDLRMQYVQKNGYKIVQDCYNANPESMKLGLNFFAKMPNELGGRKIAVLGNMLELGDQTKQFHQQIGCIIPKLPIDYLITLGNLAEHIAFSAIQFGFSKKQVYIFYEKLHLVHFLKHFLNQNDTLYLKASRAIGLESIVSCL